MGNGSDDSDWNEATTYLFRIHASLWVNDEAKMSSQYKKQLSALYTVHGELSAQMVDNKGNDDGLKKAEELWSKAHSIVGLWDAKRNVSEVLVLKALYNYELHLRLVMKKRKMDMPRRRDLSKSLLEGNE
jgi:hypothetical protein